MGILINITLYNALSCRAEVRTQDCPPFVWPFQSENYVSHVIRDTQTSLTEMNHVN